MPISPYDGYTAGSNWIRANQPVVVTNVSALRALDKTKISYAVTKGYYTEGDGGAGEYWYDSSDTTSTDNGGSVIVGSDSGRWKLVTSGVISIRQFGAKGDGSADDTQTIQNAMTIAHTQGATIYVPTGTYVITQSIVKPASFYVPNIFGDGMSKSILKGKGFSSGNFGVSLLRFEGGSGAICGAEIYGLMFDSFDAKGHGVEVCGQDGITFRKCGFNNLVIGGLLHNKKSGDFSEYVVFEDCSFDQSVLETLVYTRTGGNDSFHGSGLKNCYINETTTSTTSRIRIGGSGSTSNDIIVYNAPMSFQLWKKTTTPAIVNNSTRYTTSFHGVITLELFDTSATNPWVIANDANKTFFVGSVCCGTGGSSATVSYGSFTPCRSLEVLNNGTVSANRGTYQIPKKSMVSGSNVLCTFPIVGNEMYLVRAEFMDSTANSPTKTYLLIVSASGSIKTVNTISQTIDWFGGLMPYPTFSISGSTLVATAEFNTTVVCSVSITQIANDSHFNF